MKKKSWTEEDLHVAVEKSTSVRQVLAKLNLKEAGGNYAQIKKFLKIYKVNTKHFTGRGWSKGMRGIGRPRLELKADGAKDLETGDCP
jgi:hypothetical protein